MNGRGRAIVFDLDNTLLRREKRISDDNHAALHEAADAGFALIIATSRPIRSIRRFLPGKLLARCSTITLNGAVAWSPGAQRARYFGTIGASLAPLLGVLTGFDQPVSYSLETDGTRFGLSHALDPAALWSVHAATPDMVIPDHQIDHGRVTKVALDGHGQVLNGALDLTRQFPDVHIIPSDEHTFVNILPAHIDKGPTLDAIAGELGLDLRASVAFGDDLPDLGLLSRVGTGVAMRNADDAVKAAADEIIGDCDEDTIAEWIRDRLLC